MFNDIKKTERNITKTLTTGAEKYKLEGLADMYRQVSSLLYKTEELKDKVYPEIKKEFDEIFQEQDRMVTRVLQIGDLIATISKDSVRNSESVNMDQMIADLKTALPEYEQLIQQTYDATLQLTRIQVSPSLYVLNKDTADPERLKKFTEGKLAKFLKSPSLELLVESKAEMRAVRKHLREGLGEIIARLKPFMDKLYRTIRSIGKKSDDIFDKYVAPYIATKEPVLLEEEGVESPYVTQIKRLSKKATAQLDTGAEYVGALKTQLEAYSDLVDIINRAEEMKKEISNELKEEMSNLFETEERIYNNVIDLGSNIVAFTSINETRAGAEKTVAKKFIELLSEAIPEMTTMIEDIYKAHVTTSEYTAKSSIKVSKENISESIETLRGIYTKLQSFAFKIVNALLPRLKKVEKINDQLSSIVGELSVVTESVDEVSEDDCCFCVYQPNVAVFGAGATEDEAFEQAKQWVDSNSEDWKGNFQVAKCSSEVVDYYNVNGTPDSFVVEDGVLRIV